MKGGGRGRRSGGNGDSLLTRVVYPGDLITSIFTKNISTGIWTDSVSIERGETAKKAGYEPLQGSFTFDPSSGFGVFFLPSSSPHSFLFKGFSKFEFEMKFY